MRMNHCIIKLISRHRASFGTRKRNHHVAHEHQSIDRGLERTQPIRELFRQHRDHPTWKIHACTALTCRFIQRIFGRDVMADVSNRHQQSPGRALACLAHVNLLAIHRVVKIACVFAIDRNKRHITQINTVLQIGGTHCVWQFFGLTFSRL